MNPLGLITEIQRFSLHDGPGIRTTVFFKGCPLSCAWCHNPECILPKKELLFYPEKCIGCGRCEEGCFAEAKVLCGVDRSPEELCEELLEDQSYFGTQGGITFSGGEPLLQRDFLLACLRILKKKGVHCAVETSLFLYDEEVFRSVDLILADFKIWDDALHRRYTGVSNLPIREHFLRLGGGTTPILARTPLIPEIEQGIEEISRFLQGIPAVREYSLLPYHPLGLEKARALGLSQQQFSIPSEDLMERTRRYAFLR